MRIIVRLIAVLLFPVCWAAAGYSIYRMTGYWHVRSFSYDVVHAWGVCFLLVAPFIVWILLDVSDCLGFYSQVSSSQIGIKIKKES